MGCYVQLDVKSRKILPQEVKDTKNLPEFEKLGGKFTKEKSNY